MRLDKMTKEERQEKFTKELQALLKKYDVEISLEDESTEPYSERQVMVVNFNFQLKGDSYVELSEKNLGTWIDGN